MTVAPTRRAGRDQDRGEDRAKRSSFAFGKATIEPASQNLLDEIAFVINDIRKSNTSRWPATPTRWGPMR